MNRVVVTGIGLVSPLGIGVSQSWKSLLACKSGIAKVPSSFFDMSELPSKIAGIVPFSDEYNADLDAIDINEYISAKERKRMDRFIQHALLASKEAMDDSGWVADSETKALRTGVLIGSGIGGLDTITKNVLAFEKGGIRKVSPFFIPASLINLASGYVSMKHNLKGPNSSIVTACASGTHAIGDAANLIRCGYADVMVAGGAEGVAKVGIIGFSAMKALSTKFNDTPDKASRPWDKDRDGFVIAEGSGILVLEEYEHARKRGANIYAEVTGYGMSGDAHHITAPHEDGIGAYNAMKMALASAKLDHSDIDYINAHGTSTPVGDGIELRAVERLFGDSGYSMSSTKSSIGHLLGAAGSVEAIFSILALRDNVLPATLNLDNPPEDCKVDLIPHIPKEAKISTVLSNSFGFGGTNASIILSKV